MRVSLEIMTGGFFYYDVEDDAAVQDLKEEIGAHLMLPASRLILAVAREENRLIIGDDRDGERLVECGVGDGSHLYLIIKPLPLPLPCDDGDVPRRHHDSFCLPDHLICGTDRSPEPRRHEEHPGP